MTEREHLTRGGLFLYNRGMTEYGPSPEQQEQGDPELTEISQRFGTVIEVLGYREDGATAQFKADFMTMVEVDNGFNRDNPEHRRLLGAYQEVAEPGEGEEAEVAIGYQLAQAQMWLELDDPNRFFDRMYDVTTMLENTPGLDAVLVEVTAVVDYLQSLNTNQPEA